MRTGLSGTIRPICPIPTSTRPRRDDLHRQDAGSRPPYLYPTPEGRVQTEWSLGAHEVGLEIDLEYHIAEWHRLDLNRGTVCEMELDLNAVDAWIRLANAVRVPATDRESR